MTIPVGGGGGYPQQLSAEQIARVAYLAGFRGQDLVIATAIAMAESRGNRLAVNPSGEHSVGLWQINMDAHGTRFGTEDMLKDPMVNAKAAFALYQGRKGFGDWSVYSQANVPGYSNPYTRYINEAAAAVSALAQGGSIDTTFDTTQFGSGHPGDSERFGRFGSTDSLGAQVANPYDIMGPTAGFGSFAGGGGGAGGVGGAAADTDASGTIDEAELAAHIQRTYPQMLWALDHPELGQILRKAAEESWDQARLFGALIQTDFWRNHPDRERVLINLRETDPATYQRMVDEKAAEIMALAEGIGWGSLPNARLQSITAEALANGWSPQQIADRIIEAVPITLEQIEAGNVGGRIVEIKQNLDQISNDYLLEISDREKTEWIRRVLSGQVDEQAFVEYMQQIALGQYPWLADAMERGVTPKAFLTPYQNWIAQTLEVSPDTIDMRQRRYLHTVYDREQAEVRTLPQVEEYIKTNFREWHSTRQANEQYATVNETLLKTFGKVG